MRKRLPELQHRRAHRESSVKGMQAGSTQKNKFRKNMLLSTVSPDGRCSRGNLVEVVCPCNFKRERASNKNKRTGAINQTENGAGRRQFWAPDSRWCSGQQNVECTVLLSPRCTRPCSAANTPELQSWVQYYPISICMQRCCTKPRHARTSTCTMKPRTCSIHS